MKTALSCLIFLSLALTGLLSCQTKTEYPLTAHPDSKEWQALFAEDLSNAIYPDTVWSVEDGIFTATEDQFLWTSKEYENFILDLEFKNAEGTNSGVVLHCSDLDNWIPNSVEIQIADDYSEQWANSPKSWQCGALFGRQPASKSAVKKPGEWNAYTITVIDSMIYVLLNGEQVNEINLAKFTDAKNNPNGTEAPSWLSKAPASLPLKGRIGFQGKHAGAPIYFRNIRIREL
ncbi:MAG: DUF1080 domain-containing protein [Cyclobacteriaceae bacterium]|nr:DUF1080 domain-containing protein [Cyclobacteriaceae bacterium]